MEGLVKGGKVRVGDTLWTLAVDRVMMAGVDADLMVREGGKVGREGRGGGGQAGVGRGR
jgi:hypothetical protein